MKTIGDTINELVENWKKAEPLTLSDGEVFSMKEALETSYKLSIFKYEQALKEIENLKIVV